MDSKSYIDNCLLHCSDQIKAKGEPNCYVICLTDSPPLNTIIGEPLAIFKNKQSLYDKLQEICDNTDTRYGICIAFWWFDD